MINEDAARKVRVVKGEFWYKKLVGQELEVIRLLPKGVNWLVRYRDLPHPIPSKHVEVIE